MIFQIIGVVAGASGSFTIPGDSTGVFQPGYKFQITGSTGNDGIYSTVSSTLNGGNTEITVASVPNATVDGELIGGIYTIDFADVANGTFDLLALVIDTTNTSLALPGRGTANYGESLLENSIHMLENFAKSTSPANPIQGQQWYDNVNHVLKHYTGATWTADLNIGTDEINFVDPQNPNNASAVVSISGSDDTFPDSGLAIRTGTNPTAGSSILRVLDAAGTETLRVEYGAGTFTSNHLEVDAGIGARDSYIRGRATIGSNVAATKALTVIGDGIDVNATGGTTAIVNIKSGTTNDQTKVEFRNSANTLLGDVSVDPLVNSGTLYLNRAANTRDVIVAPSGTGNVGIGIAGSPTAKLDVLGNMLLTGTATITTDLIVDSTTLVARASDNRVGINKSPAATAGLALDVNGNVEVTGNIHATGNITADGNIVLGNAATDTIDFNADVVSNIIPDVTNTYDLGSTGQRWKDGWFAGTVHSAGMNLGGDILPGADSTYDLGSTALRWAETWTDTIAITNGTLVSSVADGALAVGFNLNTSSTLLTAGAKLFTITNNGVEVLGIDNVDTTPRLLMTGNIHATGNITAGGNIVLGDAPTDTVTFNADITSNIIPDVTNTYDVGSTGQRWKDGWFAGNMTVGGNLIASGNVTLGDAATDTLTINADITSNIIPDATNTYDLGSTTQRWKDGWFAGNMTVAGNTTLGDAATDTITFTADIASNMIPSATNTHDIGSTTDRWKDGWFAGNMTIAGNLTASGNITLGDADTDTLTINADIVSHLTPDVTNTNDLGSTTQRWKDGWFAGNLTTNNLNVEALAVTLNSDYTGVDGEGNVEIVVNRGGTVADAKVVWNETTNVFEVGTVGDLLPVARVGEFSIDDLTDADTTTTTPTPGDLLSFDGTNWVPIESRPGYETQAGKGPAAGGSEEVYTMSNITFKTGGTNVANLQVFVDGTKQIEGGTKDFVLTNSTTITFNAGSEPALNADVEFYAF